MSALDVLRAYVAAWNDHRVDVIVGLYDVEARRVSPLGALEGPDAIRSFVQSFFAMSPDTTIELGRTAENESDVLFEFADRGTHQGPLKTPAGEAAGTGRTFNIRGRAPSASSMAVSRTSACTSTRPISSAN